MFSKKRRTNPEQEAKAVETAPSFLRQSSEGPAPSHTTKATPSASLLAPDLTINGNLKTTGNIVIEGRVYGNITAHRVTVSEGATNRGEIAAEDIVVNGSVIGRLRALRVRLTSSARVEGNILHKNIAIEAGAHIDGSVQRQDNPLQTNDARSEAAAATPNTQPAPRSSKRPGSSQATKKTTTAQKGAQNG